MTDIELSLIRRRGRLALRCPDRIRRERCSDFVRRISGLISTARIARKGATTARYPRALLAAAAETIWAAPHLRAAPPLWSESGRGGGVSDLGGGEQPTAEGALRRRPGRLRPGRGMCLCARRPRDARWNKRIERHPRPHARACVPGGPPRGLEMSIAPADSTPMARSQESPRSPGSTRYPAAASHDRARPR
jgi:hypothetical protein